MSNLRQLINDNTAILDAVSNHQQNLEEYRLQCQHAALVELRDEIEPAVKSTGYNIALFKTLKHHLLKPKCYEDQYQLSEEHAWLIKIEFEYSKCLKDSGESENYYAPHVHNGEHCGGNDPAYIKISWDDSNGAYRIVPNVGYEWNKERDNVNKLMYSELHGTKEMVIQRLAVVLANVIRLERKLK
jgi:hypothetical protein